ncbi:MAG: GAF domain-containing protein [Chloroflexota bacterium]
MHVERDEQGKIVRFYGANQNITERKLTEEELRARDLQLSAALEQTEQRRLEAEALVRELDVQKYALDQHSIVAITDVAGEITYANDKFVEISKYTREELLGQDHRLLNSGYHSKEFIRNLWVTIANGNVFHGELRNRAKDGSLYWVDTTIVPLLNASGKPERYLAIRTDITQRKRDEEVIAKRASELQAVAEIATHASQADNIADLLQTVVDMTKSSYNLYHAHIYILNEDKTKLALAAGAGEVGRKMVAQKRTIDLDHPHSLVARAARTGSGAISNDVTQEPDFLPNPLLPDTKAEMAIPIKSGDMVIGILDVQADYVNRFTEEDIAIKTTLAQQVAASLENIQQYQIAQKVARELEVVANVSTATATISDVDLLLQEVVDKTKAAFNLYHAHVYLLNEAGDTLELAAGAGEVGRKMVSEGRQIPLDSEKSLVARAARNGKGQVVNDVTADPDFLPHPLLPDTKSEQAVPMIVAGNVIGVLDVQSELFNRFTEIDVNINTTLAAQTAVALQNARTYSQAQRQAQRESALNVISQKIQSATTVEAVLQIAARELGHALGAPMTIAQLSMKDSKS